jgi:hypothetical protein
MKRFIDPPAAVRAVEDLGELAARINAEHEGVELDGRRLLERCRAVGELLLEVKRRCGHGRFLPWIKANVRFDRMTATRYMRVAREWSKCNSALHLTDALRLLTEDEDRQEVNLVDKVCNSEQWFTPSDIVDRVRAYFNGPIPLDPATAAHNPTGAVRFFTTEDDGLRQSWSGGGVFVNPPYGEQTPDWCRKIREESDAGLPIVALLPCGARFSTEYWQEEVLSDRLRALCFVRGRVAFVNPEGQEQAGNPYDSAIYGFNVDRERFRAAFGVLGAAFAMDRLAGPPGAAAL